MAETNDYQTSLTVWIISDDKPGHSNQSLGLAEALVRVVPTQVFTFRALPTWRAWVAFLFRKFPHFPSPSPDVILGAGHATHLSLLAAKRACGGRTIVLMKPSLPSGCFDLRILPEHDGVAANERTLLSEGALNRIQPSSGRDTHQGLILLGGVSKHFDWDNDAIMLQIKSILARTPDTHWILTTSRRTPPDFLSELPASPNLTVTPHTDTTLDWLSNQLAQCGTVWVTPDSASMVYEALTAGADVGVFDLPVRPKSRVGWAIAHLADSKRITRFVYWCAHGTLHRNRHPLAEADRCADWIHKWLKKKN